MSPIDKQLIIRKIKLIDEDLNKLKEFKNIKLNKYLEDFEVRLKVERLLERIVGRIIDINYHVLKEEFNIIPNDYYHSFTLIGEKGAINRVLVMQISPITGLRNALAHEYDEIDNTQVYESIGKCLTLIPQYLEKILDKYT